MTAPAPIAEDPHRPPPPPEEGAAIALIAALIAAGALAGVSPTAITGSAALAILTVLRRRLKIPDKPARAALRITASVKITVEAGAGAARRHTQATQPTYRAAYLVQAAKRLSAAATVDRQQAQRSDDETVPSRDEILRRAIEREQRLFAQHLEAQERRADRAVEVDKAAARHGALLGWYATLDSKTTVECRAAHGKNFLIDRPPAIGWPGTLHAGFCRCRPGPPHATDRLV